MAFEFRVGLVLVNLAGCGDGTAIVDDGFQPQLDRFSGVVDGFVQGVACGKTAGEIGNGGI